MAVADVALMEAVRGHQVELGEVMDSVPWIDLDDDGADAVEELIQSRFFATRVNLLEVFLEVAGVFFVADALVFLGDFGHIWDLVSRTIVPNNRLEK